VWKILRPFAKKKFAASADRRFKLYKRSQLFIRTHNETLSVAGRVRLQSTSFARWNQSLRHSPNGSRGAWLI